MKHNSLLNENKPLGLNYFFLMDEDKKREVKNWLFVAQPKTKKQQVFLDLISEAIECVTYNYEISLIEPTVDEKGGLYFEPGKKVARGLFIYEWEKKAKQFAPQYKSRLASLNELFLWYAYRIAKGNWTIEFVCDEMFNGGTWNPKKSLRNISLTGKTIIGAYADGIGNTYKIVSFKSGFAMCGGIFFINGVNYPVADIYTDITPDFVANSGTGVVVIIRDDSI